MAHAVPFYEERLIRGDLGLRTPLWALSAPQYLWAVVCWDRMRSVDRMRWLRVRCATDYTTAVDGYLAMEALAMLIGQQHKLGRVSRDWRDQGGHVASVRAAARSAGTGSYSTLRTCVITATHTPYAQLRGLLEDAERACGFDPKATKQWATQMMYEWHSYGRRTADAPVTLAEIP